MRLSSDDEIVIAEGSAAPSARLYRWLLDHLAKFPGRVTALTFAAGVAVTVFVVVVDGDESPTTVVSLVATLWALFFAVMIYLLTARDTDRVLDQIADLHEQLATALAAPGEDDGETTTDEPGAVTGAASATAIPDVSTTEAGPTERAPAVRATLGDGRNGGWPAPDHGGRVRPSPSERHRPHLLSGVTAILDGVPSDLLTAWASATGKSRDELARAWTRDPRTDRQWVLETTGHERWVVFSRGGRGVGVMSLDQAGRGRRR